MLFLIKYLEFQPIQKAEFWQFFADSLWLFAGKMLGLFKVNHTEI